MSRGFKDLGKLLKHLEDEVKKSMDSDVASTVKQVQSKQVKDKVFKPYTPFMYRRRAEGGLDDVDNMHHKVKKVGNDIELSIENKTTGYNDTSFEIAGLVEFGHQNGYGEYDYDYNRDDTAHKFLNPRPFIQATRDELEKAGDHKGALARSLRDKGINVK